ncbi:hypothetical protein GCM10029964_066310 [Kibdelosporangium lantanae]
MSATVTVPAGQRAASDLVPSLSLPSGWQAGPATPASVRRVESGGSATFTWPVTVGKAAKVNVLTATIAYRSGRPQSTSDTRVAGTVPPRPAAGENPVSGLEFLSASNGWGPVERDTSVGEDKPGDGRPITLRGTGYAKGLGAHAPGDVAIYLGGACDRLTATVGVDDETQGAGSVVFRVLLDGKTLTTTPVLTGTSAPVSLDVPVTDGQVLDLVVDDAGDGNGHDHADWAQPVLTCRG